MVVPKNIKLTYFAGKGRAEPTRLAFHIGGVAFQDERVKGEEFAKIKPTLPLGQLPIITIDGTVIAQSLGILRYAGTLTGLYPNNDPLKALLVDQIVFSLGDVTDMLVPTFGIQDLDQRIKARKEIVENRWPALFKGIEEALKKHGGKYCVGDNLTVADLSLYTLVEGLKSGILDGVPKNVVEPYPLMTKFSNQVANHPKVVEWEKAHQ
ncbi:Thioredoxin-like fold domain-containing protein [Rozella allomycis CSF55]|uniref:Thioredoxin-like fold domain-containing protein n=1 Tax=Rozella allomycis (strain CSF55) TaxID=988480 RepID=A0A075B151_ROZAC|nr:Thioredoxin-like fold domain-containing protein [Rozella allomycis CSF55]|eukprot:EPZ36256.1 Thioredoxin-like fold domain-containing protein [Rozella allomycis CSF55]